MRASARSDVYYGMADYEIGRGRLTFERSTDNEGRMIEPSQGFPDNVVACAAKGQVTKKDYEQALIPDVERALERNAKIRCYYELSPEFAGFDAGAAWEDAKLGIEHLTRWERVAVVTDVEWIRLATSAFRFLYAGAGPSLFRCGLRRGKTLDYGGIRGGRNVAVHSGRHRRIRERHTCGGIRCASGEEREGRSRRR